MTKMIIDYVRDFYETEIVSFKLLLNTKPNWCKSDKEIRRAMRQAIDRCLGVAFFVQSLDVPYEQVEAEFDNFKFRISEVYENDTKKCKETKS